MILLYLEGSGSKFHSVNTKTSQFCQFFGVQELRKKHVNTKTSQFPPFFWFQELTKKYVNTKTSQFSPFLDSRSWEKTCMYIYIICIYVHMYITWFCYIWRVVVLSFIPSTPKLVNFLHFLDSRNWEKTCVYIICIYVHMYITWFCYIWRVVVLSFIPSTPKLVNFANFLESRSWGKNMSTPKLVNFPSFGFQELRKNLYIHIYIIFKCVHMYITWFCYIWRVVVLSFIPSAPKLINFHHFWISGVEKKHVYIHIYIICKYVHMYITWFCYIWRVVVLSFIPSTPKLANFSFFWIPRVEKKHVYICVYISNNFPAFYG